METGRIIMESDRFALTVQRLCHQLIEQYDDFSNACVVGVQNRGVWLSQLVVDSLAEFQVQAVKHGKLDITFYRDDFRTREKPLRAHSTDMPFLLEGLDVVLVDDVLYTGRTIQAALTALNHYGRPKSVSLLVMVDRQFNRHLPIQADFTGIRVDALDEAYVQVEFEQHHGKDLIILFPQKPA
ncbi:MAG: bifunctional pyr operon transcriptional regulator/uracil phosphoribosyltransferase PyrR [Saprospiraceae bacterium]